MTIKLNYNILLTILLSLNFIHAPVTNADVLLSSGVPSGGNNISVFSEGPGFAGQFLAQTITFDTSVHLTSVEVYFGGSPGNSMQVDLTTVIGDGTSSSEVLATSRMNTSGLPASMPTFVPILDAFDLMLDPGTYFLVFSAGDNGGYLPTNAPINIGQRYVAPDDLRNNVIPAASNFILPSFGGGPHGIRIIGSEIPEPSTAFIAVLILPVVLNRKLRV